ncbi:hypothetical protein MASR2M15_00380 [Anaerolineales bacterium]
MATGTQNVRKSSNAGCGCFPLVFLGIIFALFIFLAPEFADDLYCAPGEDLRSFESGDSTTFWCIGDQGDYEVTDQVILPFVFTFFSLMAAYFFIAPLFRRKKVMQAPMIQTSKVANQGKRTKEQSMLDSTSQSDRNAYDDITALKAAYKQKRLTLEEYADAYDRILDRLEKTDESPIDEL